MESIIINTPNGNRKIGKNQPCFVIAEMSGNHNQSFDKAVEIIKAAAAAGADAIKFQTYTPDTMTIDCDKEYFLVDGKDNPDMWKNKFLYDLYKTAYTPWEWHKELQKIAYDLGLVFFSTPFDSTAVEFLEELDVPCYKISSYEATDLPLLKKVAATRKPVIISVGFADLSEVEEAINALRDNGTKEIIVLHCVTAYSSEPKLEETNLCTMLDISKRFDVLSGFSDNNAGLEIPLQAVAMGACVVEKHLTNSQKSGGIDESFSADANEFKKLVKGIRRIEKISGKLHYGTQGEAEEYNKRFRRSLFVVKNIKKGEQFTSENVRVIRPNFGLAPKYYDKVIGKIANKDLGKGMPLKMEYII